MRSWFQDIRYSWRTLRKAPGFAAVCILTLALSIGANTVAFSVLNAILLRPLNLPQEESLYSIERDHLVMESYPNYLDLRDRNRSFDGLAAFTVDQPALDAGQGPSLLWAVEASGNYFDVLGTQPYLGRVFHASDEHGPNSAPYIVLSYAYWHSHFQDDRGAIGRVVQLNKHPYTILGVAPPEFHGTLLFVHPDFFVPIVNQEQVKGWSGLNDRGNRSLLMAMGHLKPGITPAQAIADLNSIGSYLEKSYPRDDSRMSFTLSRPGLFGEFLGRPMRAFVAGLMLLAGLILLAACANLGSLFAARAADRSREVALRLALGAGRNRILRALFTEALLISLVGGAVGVWISVLVLRWVSAWRPLPDAFYVLVNPDARVYAVAVLLALASGFLFGAAPMRQVLRTDPYQIVKAGSTGAVGRRIALRDILLGLQIAICTLLVTSSLVAARGQMRALHSNLGFEPRGTTLAQIDLNMAGYSGEKVPAMQKRMIDAVQTLPAVKYVGLIDVLPITDTHDVPVFADKTTELTAANAAANQVNMLSISPDYFRAAGTLLLSGRTFTWHDDKNAPRVAVINEEFARKVFGSAANAVGAYYKMQDGTHIQVVGIVEDGKYRTLTEDLHPAMFLPILQAPSKQTWLVVRSDGDQQQLAAAMESKLRELDAGLPLPIDTWNDELVTVLLPSRIATVALSVMGAMGAMLAVTGIFGLAAYSVSKRMRELGIRVALGAQRKGVLEAALGRVLKLLVFGSVVGLLLGILASRVLAFIVYQATPRDPLVLAGVVLAMALLGLAATWIPARRALAVDPLILLREE
ncbi:MAG TPA: ABC transporter permease [Candidatus Angelobacter sp.]